MSIEQPPSQSNFRVTTLISLLLFVASVVILFVFFFPERDMFETNSQLLVQKQTELNTVKTKLSQVENIESEFKGGEVTKKDILYLVPEEVEQDVVIATLANTASETEASLNSVSFGIGAGQELDAQILTITLNISGKHEDLIDFLNAIEDDSRKFVVNTISVQTLENGLENMSVTMEAYFL